jgi:hypothetical protein
MTADGLVRVLGALGPRHHLPDLVNIGVLTKLLETLAAAATWHR